MKQRQQRSGLTPQMAGNNSLPLVSPQPQHQQIGPSGPGSGSSNVNVSSSPALGPNSVPSVTPQMHQRSLSQQQLPVNGNGNSNGTSNSNGQGMGPLPSAPSMHSPKAFQNTLMAWNNQQLIDGTTGVLVRMNKVCLFAA